MFKHVKFIKGEVTRVMADISKRNNMKILVYGKWKT